MKTYFTLFEKLLWSISVVIITISFLVAQIGDYLTLIASILGMTLLIFNAKGNVWGQVLTVIFSILYGMISYTNAYYGEMITYLGMTMPIAIASVVSWLRHPSEKGKNEVKVNHIKKKEYLFLAILSMLVTVPFFFVLKAFHTNSLPLSTVSVLTSFVASYLTLRRSEYYAVGYAANDLVLIGLWMIAACENIRYVGMVICFIMFFLGDLYGFINWRKMKRSQSS